MTDSLVWLEKWRLMDEWQDGILNMETVVRLQETFCAKLRSWKFMRKATESHGGEHFLNKNVVLEHSNLIALAVSIKCNEIF